MDGVINQSFWGNGPQPGSFYNLSGKSSYGNSSLKHTLQPMTTGTSVLGVKFAGGVMLAADTLGSYGSLARFKSCSRVMKVNDTTVLGAGGDYADFQYLKSVIEQKVIDEECLDDGFNYTPKALFSWVTRVMYNRRSKFDPLWNTVVVGGLQQGQPYLGYVDKIGMAYETPTVASGYGSYIALPMMRDAYEKKQAENAELTEAEARELLERCLVVLYYRDARSINKYELAIVTAEGSRIEGPISAKTNWDIANMVSGYE